MALRLLIKKIVLTPGPERGEIYATLHGELGQALSWTEQQSIERDSKIIKLAVDATGLLVSLAAGTRFQKYAPLYQGERPQATNLAA